LKLPELPSFPEFFQSLWGFEPFPWQAMLTERICKGPWPEALDLPTAAGKTACIDAAVYALAAQAGRPMHERTAPRRIWFVVDRRIVVDEAYERAVSIAQKLAGTADGPLKAIADRLCQFSGTKRPLTTARLRGGILRDDNCARLPSQPAVITSTVDQLGSRLLFRSYGGSQRVASIHAGLVGNDSLILLDEAHCSVPFMQTLRYIQGYRGSAWTEQPIDSPFAFAILSATPPLEIPQESIFPGESRDAALAHPVLDARLRATKPAELVNLKASRKATIDVLVEEAAVRAVRWVREEGKRRVAVIVNRVQTASHIAERLHAEVKPDEADVVLLTGRLRPLERDVLTEQWKRFLRASNPDNTIRPVLFVSTQAIEVGADFSFDALVTECASLDALRQRFGRLNRMGLPDEASAAILAREEDLKHDVSDPIYGDALRYTWSLLLERAKTEAEGERPRYVLDFGFTAVETFLSELDDERLLPCLAPQPDAPVLLPAHLDLLSQTAPTPLPEPDISLFLHGKDRGISEVRVVWRADLDLEATELWVETIALCPPLSMEAVSVPLYRLRRWLAGRAEPDIAGDVEGGEKPDTAIEYDRDHIRPCLPWRGCDRSAVAVSADEIFPGDVVVVPAAYGLAGLAQTLADYPEKAGFGTEKSDLWEWALESAGKPRALRIHRRLWEPWLECRPMKELVSYAEEFDGERESLWSLIDELIAYQPPNEAGPPALPEWHLAHLRSIPRNARIDTHPGGGLILFDCRRTRVPFEPDLFADDDDLTSMAGEAISLKTHTVAVVGAVQKMAEHCLPAKFLEPLQLAAEWHDVGKLDERFQLLLRRGNEVAVVTEEPLAKSPNLPISHDRRTAIREASGLPDGFRHEMLSAQLAERFAALPADPVEAALVLHLIASHHGHARPFAPVSLDAKPSAIVATLENAVMKVTAEDRDVLVPAHRIDSGIADRFWKLTRRYGWWGLTYLEANLRLADWYGSEFGPAQKESVENTP
jgi:CRISPR-associated endonuclease/helicase Cas3